MVREEVEEEEEYNIPAVEAVATYYSITYSTYEELTVHMKTLLNCILSLDSGLFQPVQRYQRVQRVNLTHENT